MHDSLPRIYHHAVEVSRELINDCLAQSYDATYPSAWFTSLSKRCRSLSARRRLGTGTRHHSCVAYIDPLQSSVSHVPTLMESLQPRTKLQQDLLFLVSPTQSLFVSAKCKESSSISVVNLTCNVASLTLQDVLEEYLACLDYRRTSGDSGDNTLHRLEDLPFVQSNREQNTFPSRPSSLCLKIEECAIICIQSHHISCSTNMISQASVERSKRQTAAKAQNHDQHTNTNFFRVVRPSFDNNSGKSR